MSRTRSRNLQSGVPTRSIRVADKLWHEIELAAEIAGVRRNQFILGVLKHAAHQILKEEKKDQ